MLLNKTDCIIKMENILGNSSKFRAINDDEFKVSYRQQNKVNRSISKLCKEVIFSSATYDLRIHGLPNIHIKRKNARQITSAIGTCGCSVSV